MYEKNRQCRVEENKRLREQDLPQILEALRFGRERVLMEVKTPAMKPILISAYDSAVKLVEHIVVARETCDLFIFRDLMMAFLLVLAEGPGEWKRTVSEAVLRRELEPVIGGLLKGAPFKPSPCDCPECTALREKEKMH